MSTGPVRPVYLAVDTSGSTLRSAFNEVVTVSLPVVADALAATAGSPVTVAVLGFGTDASLLVGAADVGAVSFPSRIAAGGFSSLAAGIRLLGDVILADAAQASADGVSPLPSLVVVVTDGMPTDTEDAIRTAYGEWATRIEGFVAEVLVVVAGDTVARSVAGLGEGRVSPDLRTAALPEVEAAALVSLLVGWLGRDRVTTST